MTERINISVDSPKQIGRTFNQFQKEQQKWVAENFPQTTSDARSYPLRGLIEEIGEMVEAKTTGDRADAIADFVIFAGDYCSRRTWNLQEIIEAPIENEFVTIMANHSIMNALYIFMGRLFHSDLKSEQKIRVREEHDLKAKSALNAALFTMSKLAQQYGYNFEALVFEQWDKVKQRSWSKDAATGGAVVTPPTASVL